MVLKDRSPLLLANVDAGDVVLPLASERLVLAPTFSTGVPNLTAGNNFAGPSRFSRAVSLGVSLVLLSAKVTFAPQTSSVILTFALELRTASPTLLAVPERLGATNVAFLTGGLLLCAVGLRSTLIVGGASFRRSGYRESQREHICRTGYPRLDP